MMPSNPNDPEWVAEKMFGEEFDSPIVYYVVDLADDFVFFYGSLEDCKEVQDTNYAGLTIVDYSMLTPEMRSSLKDPF